MKNRAGTPREWEIAAAVMRWGCRKDAATGLGITSFTVRNSLSNLYRKYGVETLIELAMVAGWLDIPPNNLPIGRTTRLSAGDITAATLSSDAG